jgi:arabinogalactan oligomer/maltooligosaccharide transport system substrate-binding protein
MNSRRRTIALLIAFAGAIAAFAGTVQASTRTQPTLVIWTDSNRLAAMTQLGNAWGNAHNVTVNVVQKNFGVSGAGTIGGDLSTTDSANAPDVITAAHDWTGALASNGLIVPLHMSSKAKKKFIPWTIKAFSFGTAVSNLYAVPTQTENLGLVVNTKLAKVPTTFASLYKAAMAFKKKHHNKVGLAVPDGAPNGDPYHMEPLLTGLCGYVFGYNHAGNFDPSNIGVANKKFLKHASMIDAWNKSGFISSSLDYGTAETMFLKGKIPFWITGPWESGNLTNSKYHLKFKVVHFPNIACASTPFLGSQGVEISKYASTHEVSALATDFVQNYLATTSAQVALANANGRLPALTAAVSKIHNKVLNEFAAASTGGNPMPNITQMNSVWTFLGQAWVNSTKGNSATKAAPSFKKAQHQIANAIG